MAGRKTGGIPSKLDADGLTPKRRLFCLEYLLDLNATQAAIRAGYAEASAHVEGSRLLADAKVQAFLGPKLAKKEKRLELAAARLDEELARCAYVDPGALQDPETGEAIPVHKLPEDVRRAVRGVKIRELWSGGKDPEQIGQVVEVKLEPKVEAIGLAYRRLGLLRDKLEIKGKVRNLSHEEVLLLAQRIRAKQLAARAGAAGGKPGAPARGHR